MQRTVHRPLGFHAGTRGRVIKRGEQRHQPRIATIALHRHRALRRGRQPLRRLQARDDALAQTQTLQAGHGQHDGVVATVVEFGQPGVDVTAQVEQFQVRSQRAQLRLATQRRGPDPRTDRQRVQRGVQVGDEAIGWIVAGQHRRQREGFVQFHRHILQRVHGAVGLTAQHGQLQLLQEQALATDGGQRTVEHFVAAGAHRHQFHMQAGMGLAQAVGDVFALPEGERALAGGDADGFHPVIIAPPARIRPTAEPLVAGGGVVKATAALGRTGWGHGGRRESVRGGLAAASMPRSPPRIHPARPLTVSVCVQPRRRKKKIKVKIKRWLLRSWWRPR